MDTDNFWKNLAYFIFAVHTLCLIELIDVAFFGKPLITFFLITVGICYVINLKIYKLIWGNN